jgi:hypothetical protein
MGAYPEVATFRRFGALNAENLLYLQAELVRLEFELRQIAQENDCSNDLKRSIYSAHWISLMEAENTPNGDGRQWRIVLQIRERLKEYSENVPLSIASLGVFFFWLPSTNFHPQDCGFHTVTLW